MNNDAFWERVDHGSHKELILRRPTVGGRKCSTGKRVACINRVNNIADRGNRDGSGSGSGSPVGNPTEAESLRFWWRLGLIVKGSLPA